jgi:hypothetical protein
MVRRQEPTRASPSEGPPSSGPPMGEIDPLQTPPWLDMLHRLKLMTAGHDLFRC